MTSISQMLGLLMNSKVYFKNDFEWSELGYDWVYDENFCTRIFTKGTTITLLQHLLKTVPEIG